MSLSQTRSPFSNVAPGYTRADLFKERGHISRAAPAVQEQLKKQRKEERKRLWLNGSMITVAAIGIGAVAIFFLNKTAEASMNVVTLASHDEAAAEKPAMVFVEKPITENPMESLAYARNAEEFKRFATVNSVRAAGTRTKAVINGEVFRIGDVIAPQMGLVFVGVDPDGQYLLFRDAQKRTVFLQVKKPEAS